MERELGVCGLGTVPYAVPFPTGGFPFLLIRRGNRTPIHVRERSHLKSQGSASHNFLMSDPRPRQRFSVKAGAMDVLILVGYSFRLDFEHLPVRKSHTGIFEYRTSDSIDRLSRCDWIESQRGKDHKGGETASVLITRNSHQVVTEPSVEHLTDPLLSLPRRSSIVVEIRNMQRRLVSH